MKLAYLVPPIGLGLVIAGAIARVVSGSTVANRIWMFGLAAGGAPVVFRTLRSALRGHFATDVVATLSIVGSVALNQPLAGLMMVGDGVNDAPALTTADVGVALASHGRGGGITAEATDVVLLSDSLSRLGDAIDIGARTLRITRQSIGVGLALSGVAMIVAAFGGLQPAVGAGVQEVTDVAVILNALRSARDPMFTRGAPPVGAVDLQSATVRRGAELARTAASNAQSSLP